jgi:hypothetical protein
VKVKDQPSYLNSLNDLVDGAQLKYYSIPYENIYKSVPNGGVMILRVTGIDFVLERLIYVKPKETIPFELTLDANYYEPGDLVGLSI